MMKSEKKKLLIEFIKYCFAGGSAFVADALTLWLFQNMILPDMGEFMGIDGGMRVFLATAIGFVVGLIANYLISIFFVFTTEKQKKQGRNFKAFVVFSIVGVIGLVLTELGMLAGTALFGEKYTLIIKVVVAGLVLIWNYIGRKIFVYKEVTPQ